LGPVDNIHRVGYGAYPILEHPKGASLG